MDIKTKAAEWGINAIAAIASQFGALLVIVMDKNQVTFKSALAQFISAFGFAGFGAQFLSKWLHLEAYPEAIGLFGFCLGISGMFLARAVMKKGAKVEENPDSLFKK